MTEPITVLVAAVGGQGGQLFSQWLFDAAKEAGYYPVGVGLPGLSQREGATTYYLEFFRSPEGTAFFSPFPEKGHVQVLIGLELLELMRAVQEGYLAPNGALLGSTHRVLTVEEKLPLQPQLLTAERVLPTLKQIASVVIAFDAMQAAALAGLSERAANAILLGALAASGVLPFPPEAFRQAIERYGIAVAFNLRAFDFGLRYHEWVHQLPEVEDAAAQEWAALPEPVLSLATQQMVQALYVDEELARTFQHAARWLCHYQDERYFVRYLECVRLIYEEDRLHDKGLLVTKEVARVLALRMAYEDAVRVAQLKTLRQRFQRLRQEHNIDPNAVYRVVDFLSPDWDELLGLLPLPRKKNANRATEEGLPPLPSPADELQRPAVPMQLETSSLTGYLLLKGLTLLKPLRIYSRRFRSEWEAIQQWLDTVRDALREDYDLAFLVARSGALIRGYGRTRRKTLAAWHAFRAFLTTLKQRGFPPRTLVALGEEFLSLAFSGPQGPEKAWQFAREQLSRKQKEV